MGWSSSAGLLLGFSVDTALHVSLRAGILSLGRRLVWTEIEAGEIRVFICLVLYRFRIEIEILEAAIRS